MEYRNTERNIILVSLGVIAVLLFFAVKSEIKWVQYAKEHCTIVGEISGSTGIGTGINTSTGGMVVSTVYIPGKTTYKCDDGMFYSR